MKKVMLAFFALCAFSLEITKADSLVLNAVEEGIVNDGKTMNTERIQSAIDRISENPDGGKLVFTKGAYLTGALVMKSGVEFHVSKNAVILGSPDPMDYQHVKKERGSKDHCLGLFVAYNQNNFSFTGQGLIKGNGEALALNVDSLHHAGVMIDPYYTTALNRPHEFCRPTFFRFVECEDILVEDLHFDGSACWGLTFVRCSNVRTYHLSIINRDYWNNDGIDIFDCRNFHVKDCFVNSADDAVCMKSEAGNMFCDNILIEDCHLICGASAVKFGTGSAGGLKNAVIRNIKVRDTYRSAIAIECVDGGVVDNVLVENIDARNTGNAIFIRLGKRWCDKPGALRNVTIRNLHADIPFVRGDINYAIQCPDYGTFHNPFPSSITGIPGACVENVTLENITIKAPGRATRGQAYIPASGWKKVPEQISYYPEFSMFGELPCWGVFVRHVRGLKMKNMKLSLKEYDFRPPFVFEDVEGVVREGIQINQK